MAETEQDNQQQLQNENKVEVENSCGDSGIQVRDEELAIEEIVESESPDVKEQNSEDKTVLDRCEDDEIAPVLSEDRVIACDSNPDKKEEIELIQIDETPADEPSKAEEPNGDESDESRDNRKVLTVVELSAIENCRNSPEIVIEPKLVERISSGKLPPRNLRVQTPHHFSLPQEKGLAPPPLPISKRKSFCKQLKWCVLLILFTAIVIGYAIGGAYLFSHLEREREIQYNAKIDKWKNDTAILLATELRQVKPHEDIWARKVFHYLEAYERDLLKASSVGYRRQDDKDRDQRWTWTSSLFFSIALMTTTGYGPMTPRSKLGRVAALFYSLFGIPLALTWFMIIGYTLATYWASLFHNLCCRLCHDVPPDQLKDEFTSEKRKEPFVRLPKLRSNSIVPVDEQTLISQSQSEDKTSPKIRRIIFPDNSPVEFINKSDLPVKRSTRQSRNSVRRIKQFEIEFAELQSVYHKMDYAMAIVYACLLFVAYYVFFSVLFALYQGWALTDILYFNYLMFVTVGPGCHELEDDSAEIRIKNDLLYTIHLSVGYCILAMIVNLIYMLLKVQNDSEKVQKSEVFDSLHRERF